MPRYSKTIKDSDRFGPAQVEVNAGSQVVYVEASWTPTVLMDDSGEAFCVYSRKDALRLAWALVRAVLSSCRRLPR